MYQNICNRLGLHFRRRFFRQEVHLHRNNINLPRSFKHHQTSANSSCKFSYNHQRSYRTHESSWNSQNLTNRFGHFCLYGGIIAWFENSLGTKRPKLDDDEIKENIKLAILAIEEKKFDEAFDILHATLRLTRHKKNDSAENYVLDMMANLYYQTEEQYDEATRLFTELMRRLMSTGTKQNDPAMIEISLKLADIYARKGDYERAEAGYLFCVDMARQNVTKSDQEYNKISLKFKYVKNLQEEYEGRDKFNDPYALYGMVLECYAQFLVTRGRARESVDYINKSLELSQFVHGTGVHSIIMLNNYATLCLKYSQFELAEKYMKDAVARAIYMPEMVQMMPGYYCNYAEMLWHLDRREEALDYAHRAVQLAEENKDPEGIQMTRAYLRDLKADNSRPRSSSSVKKTVANKT